MTLRCLRVCAEQPHLAPTREQDRSATLPDSSFRAASQVGNQICHVLRRDCLLEITRHQRGLRGLDPLYDGLEESTRQRARLKQGETGGRLRLDDPGKAPTVFPLDSVNN